MAQDQQLALGYGCPFPSEIEFEVTLNDKLYQLRLGDEEAKLNLNALHVRRPEQLPSMLAQSAVVGGVPLLLRPRQSLTQRISLPYESWGQVVDLSKFDLQEDLATRLRSLTTTWSCWGRGKLNIYRSSDEVMRLLLDGVLLPQETEKLLEARMAFQGDLEALVKDLDIPRRRWIQAKSLLSTDSRSYSVWIRETNNLGDRTYLLVRDPSNRQTPETIVFEW
ncbi:hypothetical protein [Aeoliella sp. SH292]|uniref:hypothetical protein n=1 Tax=Aeoliella sp. SH292 TaxID=3454464 RepID=UPI003F946096